jgi:phenylacetate-CoA ligase
VDASLAEPLAGNMRDPEVETRTPARQLALDRVSYRRQLRYVFERSAFYRAKWADAGIRNASDIGELDDIARLPFTNKDEIRATQADAPPLGANQCAPWSDVARVYSTSGTTGAPCYMPVTARDLDAWLTISTRTYTTTGLRRGMRTISLYNAGPFVVGAALDALTRLGVCHYPIGTGQTERVLAALTDFRAEAVLCTPSYALYIAERLRERGVGPDQLALKHICVAGEPGGGDPVIRRRIEEGLGGVVTEAMGIGDISISLWGECEAQQGMHFSGGDFVHVELIDPQSGESVPLRDGARGELVYTALQREAAPMVRFRSRDHVVVWTEPCSCGRSTLRVRCIGRTDDMLIVRGVNLFPSAVQAIIGTFAPRVSGALVIYPKRAGVRQDPPLTIEVELGQGVESSKELASAIEHAIRDQLVVTTGISLVPYGTIGRSEYKSKLVSFARAAEPEMS